MKKPKVSIIFVYYQNLEELRTTLKSIEETKTKVLYEIIIVDNSKNGLPRNLQKKYKYIKSPGNIGYARGNNLGAKYASGDYMFILNPDTKVFPGTVDKLYKFLDSNEDAAVVSANIVDENKRPYELQGSRILTPLYAIFSFSIINKLLPNNPIANKYWLIDRSNKDIREVDVVPGTAFMIRKKIFDDLGGFDKNFFMYFEENDLGKRIKEAGWKVFIDPKAKVIHYWSPEEGGNKLKREFMKSRKYYFRKHFGTIQATLTEWIFRLDKYDLLFITLFLVAALLRFYDAFTTTYISGEIGDNLLDIKNVWINMTIPLRGPPTSHPWLNFGPLYYWLFGPILVLYDFDPVSHAYFGAVVSILTVFANYYYISQLTNKKVGLLSSVIITFSPFYLFLAHNARFFTLNLLFIYPYLYYTHKLLNKNDQGAFLPGIFMGIMLNSHYSPLMLIPPTFILVFLYIRKRFINQSLKYFLGVLTANIPLIVYDALNGFEMFFKFMVWIPYRIAGFVGLYPKNTLSVFVFRDNLSSVYTYVTDIFVAGEMQIALLFFIIFLSGASYLFKKTYKNYKGNTFWTMIIFFLIFGYLALFVHGMPPYHYYIPIAFIPGLILSKFVIELKQDWVRILLLILVVVSTLININHFRTSYEHEDEAYEQKLAAVKEIVKDVDGRSFSIERLGANDQFQGDYAQDYQYLLWWKGNEPVRVGEQQISPEQPEIHYIIVETDEDPGGEMIYESHALKLYKSDEL